MTGVTEAERRELVRQRVQAAGSVSVAELAVEYGVSTVTMRRDLDELQRRGVLTRTHGGAVRTEVNDEGSFFYRLTDGVDAKREIAARAARLVHKGDSVCLDSSSTSHYLAQEILEQRDLFIVTNSLPTANLFLEHSSATVYLTGGVVRRSSRATITASVHPGLHSMVDLGFFGLNGLSVQDGPLEISLEEAESKRQLAMLCRRAYLLADATKFSSLGLHPWMPAERVAGIFTDIDDPALAPWRAAGVRIETVEPLRSTSQTVTNPS